MPHPERACEPALGSADGLVHVRIGRRRRWPAQGALQRAPLDADDRRIDRAARSNGTASTPTNTTASCDALGREPTLTELGIFSVMWSEHCSYKSSRVHLRTLPTHGPRVLQGPGENAGAVDIGDGLAAVFKIESHNHPSFIEPYQGAATGVGGIIRDIFTMGARPIALLNSLRFGPLDGPTARAPAASSKASSPASPATATASASRPSAARSPSTSSYAGNPLVNVFCLGHRAARTRSSRARADGVGNPVYYVGAKTGRDGIHGATMASAEFDEQVGGEAAGGAGRRSVHGEAAARGVPRADEDRRARRRPGHGRRRADLLDLRDGRARRHAASRSTSRSCRSARPA